MKRQQQEFRSKEELNVFLLKRYGCGYWEFADSFVQVFQIYKRIRYEQVIKNTIKKIKELKKLKTNVVELVDEFLLKHDFYEYSKYSQVINDPKLIWTPEKKEGIIRQGFGLDSFFEKLKTFVSYLEPDLKSPYIPIAPLKIRISPLNLLVLVWSFALKARGRVTWNTMETVLSYFWRLIDRLGIIDFLPHTGTNIPSAERLRFIFNKYRKSAYIKQAEFCFILSFKEKWSEEELSERTIVFEGRTTDYSDPIVWLNELLWIDKEPAGWNKLNDMGLTFRILEDIKKGIIS